MTANVGTKTTRSPLSPPKNSRRSCRSWDGDDVMTEDIERHPETPAPAPADLAPAEPSPEDPAVRRGRSRADEEGGTQGAFLRDRRGGRHPDRDPAPGTASLHFQHHRREPERHAGEPVLQLPHLRVSAFYGRLCDFLLRRAAPPPPS
ncbi:MAG: hypothetical protein MZU97_13585 [Bacillus subtilis]|nr:hypothetical protein [Bacillus subtilis]